MRVVAVLAALAGLLVSGCAIKPTNELTCQFTGYPLTVPGLPADGARTGASFSEAIAQSMRNGAGRAGVADYRPKLLSLSGGSLHGAYGAGYLDEWRRMSGPQGLPRFENVTGISTGAILATFAFTGDTAVAVDGYSITREDQLLRPHVTMKDGDLSYVGYAKMLRKGALGDLAPLRTRLHEKITDKILNSVAQGAADGRTLYVGVVDVDTGEAEALDLTDMALRWAGGRDAAAKMRAKSCYVEAILASSSAPMAAAPVFLDGRMYIDGGARFGMFDAGFAEAARSFRASEEGKGKLPPALYLVINGTQSISTECRVADEATCKADPTGGTDGRHRDWSLLKLALRSEKILANQVYRFSEAMVLDEASGITSRRTKINNDVEAHPFRLDDPVLGSDTETCKRWREIDRANDDPIQFSARYMRCLIDYGRTRARSENWAG